MYVDVNATPTYLQHMKIKRLKKSQCVFDLIFFVWLQLTEAGRCQIRLLCFGQRADKPQRAVKSGSQQRTGLSVLPLPGLLRSIFKTEVPKFQLTFQARAEKISAIQADPRTAART